MSIEKLKIFFRAKSYLHLFIIFVVFGITGSLTLVVSDYIVVLFNVSKESIGTFFYYLLRIFLIFPVYQLLLILIGTLFGEFRYFWEFEKKFIKRIGIKLK